MQIGKYLVQTGYFDVVHFLDYLIAAPLHSLFVCSLKQAIGKLIEVFFLSVGWIHLHPDSLDEAGNYSCLQIILLHQQFYFD